MCYICNPDIIYLYCNPLPTASKPLFLIFNMTHNFELQHEVWMVDIQYLSSINKVEYNNFCTYSNTEQ
jgi:hypothetical protein